MAKPDGILTRVWAKIYTSGENGEDVTCEIYDDEVSPDVPVYIFLLDVSIVVGMGFLPPAESYADLNKDTVLTIGLRGTAWEEYERYKSTGIKPKGF